ncbi:MAG: hypothetical protein HUU17_05865 [Chthonomonadales bacterium]|nr:hypothetical protein [Chthonomonadales bacterium]
MTDTFNNVVLYQFNAKAGHTVSVTGNTGFRVNTASNFDMAVGEVADVEMVRNFAAGHGLFGYGDLHSSPLRNSDVIALGVFLRQRSLFAQAQNGPDVPATGFYLFAGFRCNLGCAGPAGICSHERPTFHE